MCIRDRDSTGNVVIRKGASPGMENRPVVVLQSHVDMVCEKRGDVNFHFDTDPIRTRVEDGWVRAEGTTLGADLSLIHILSLSTGRTTAFPKGMCPRS